MSQQTIYQTWKNNNLGKVIGDGQCVAAVDNYAAFVFPGVNGLTVFPGVEGAKDLAGKSNSYVTWIANDHNNPNQLPEQGDVMVFGATPASGYTNQTNNPYGHAGVCDSASPTEYVLCQQNSPSNGSPLNVKAYPWKFRPCIGWYRLNVAGAPAPNPALTGTSNHTIFMPADNTFWHLYAINGPYTPAHAKAVLRPDKYGGLTYDIVSSLGNGIYVINTTDFGQGAVWTQGTNAVIT